MKRPDDWGDSTKLGTGAGSLVGGMFCTTYNHVASRTRSRRGPTDLIAAQEFDYVTRGYDHRETRIRGESRGSRPSATDYRAELPCHQHAEDRTIFQRVDRPAAVTGFDCTSPR
jgi:hypothetical protein